MSISSETKSTAIPRWLLPVAVFVSIACLHLFWTKWFPPQSQAAAGWAPVSFDGAGWFARYVEGGGYWLAYAYGLSGGFASVSVRNLIESRRRDRAIAAESGIAAGSVTFAGALAFGGCFFMGCCGSPMLAVWISLFGAAFVPFAKPFIAVLTTVMIGAAWFWMSKKRKQCACGGSTCC
jgi:hypothetical protein